MSKVKPRNWRISVPKPYQFDSSKDAAEVVNRINKWAYCDIPIEPAQVAYSEQAGLPENVESIASLLGDPHKELIIDLTNGDLERDVEVNFFDPSVYCSYHGPNEGTVDFVRSYFAKKLVDVARGTGSYSGDYPFNFDWVAVLHKDNQVLFSFIFNLQD